ncbi:9287_t:CDS:2 [Funneliformis geosporum]|uniref:20060_t:CDS:1 n=1 Tax=Funneliformis geosporum TaxID=1117311 RepID=A0A9W4WX56_9GLOM|nr:20060_t:CDS:2 [Funneliformis geosporum]CAI2188142.1 9287_t:CDS:2 [Funneliformis geosporum]
MNFYKITPIKDWTCLNIVEYYNKEYGKLELSKVLDDVKKNLCKITNVNSDFDVACRVKAQEIVETWQFDTSLSSEGAGTLSFTAVALTLVMAKQQLNAIKNSATQVDILQTQFNEDSNKRSLEIQDDEEMPVKKNKFEAKAEVKHSSENLLHGNNDQHTSLSQTSTLAEDTSVEGIKKKDTEKLIEFLQKQNLFLKEKHFEILRKREIVGCDFVKMNKQDFKECGLELGPAMRLADLANKLNDQSENFTKKFTELVPQGTQ